MTYYIKKLKLSNELKNEYNTDELDNLSKVNIFIGPNNSGKSRLLRNIYQEKTYDFLPSDFNYKAINTITREYNRLKKENFKAFIIGKPSNIDSSFYSDIPELKYIQINTDYKSSISQWINNFSKMTENVKEAIRTNNRLGNSSKAIEFFEYASQDLFRDIQNEISKYSRKQYSFKKLYIPTLRGLRPFQHEIDYYKERTMKDYFKNSDDNSIFTGLGMYQQLKEHLFGDLKKRNTIKQFKNFLSNIFFEGEEITLIPRIDSDVVYIKIGNEEEYPIFHQGDGIQQLIILTFQLYLLKDEHAIVYIEEPELYLHPGLQRKFIEFLTDDTFKKLQTFFTTHSNHFLDMTLDFNHISVYKFSKTVEKDDTANTIAKFSIENSSNEDRNLLEILGVKNSSVFLTNCTIWVEGVTDRLYFRKYLEIFQKDQKQKDSNHKIFEEDKHYSFVEYSGNNITHWSFLNDDDESIDVDSLCGKLFLISDKDENKEDRHEKLTEKLGDRYYCLKCREIENLLTPEVLVNVIKSYGESDENITIPSSQSAYKIAKLGEYIEDTILKDKSKTKRKTKNKERPYSSESGTIKDKIPFAKNAIKNINTIDDLSDEAKDICEKIYNFIKSNNTM